VTQVATQSPDIATTAEGKVAVETVHLAKSIDGRAILRDVNLRVEAGAFVAVLGANGSGKTTLLKILSTLSAPSGGELKLFGEIASGGNVALRRRIGMIGHQSMLYRDLSPRENLEFFARLYALENPVRSAKQMIQMIGLAERANDPVRNFSRGMTQRVAIARALLHDPDLILADEPFAGLDAPSIEALEQLLAQLGDAGKTIILVNHDIEQSLRVAEHAVVLRGGKIVVDQPTHRLYEREVRSEVQS
jgi:heme exporter protein A